MQRSSQSSTIVLFDGQCNLCSGVVQRLITLDPSARLRFASLQSPAGLQLRQTFSVPATEDSMIVVAGGQAFLRSDAALAIGRTLGGGWAVGAAVARFVPSPIRNAAYRILAANRFRWFGKPDHCWLPTPELRARFLPDN
jgi:predicted DCC family thiol-disulfide oxidoreductase YuxK